MTRQVSHPDPVIVGELLLREGHRVPQGPPDARAAWALETGDLVEVIQVERRQSGKVDVGLRGVSDGVDGEVVARELAELARFERLDGRLVGGGAARDVPPVRRGDGPLAQFFRRDA